MLSQILRKFCKEYISKQQVEDIDIILKSSPHYPSLLSILHTLQCVGVKAVVGKCDLTYLRKIEKPFLLHLRIQNFEKVVLACWNKNSNDISIYSPNKDKWIVKDMAEIVKLWDGVIIYSEQKVRPYFKIMSYIKFMTNVIISIIFFGITTFYYGYKTGIVFLLMVIGLILSIFSLIKDYGYKNHLLEQICHVSSYIDCQKVSESKYGKIFGFKMSELAISFFSSQFIIGLITLPNCNSPYTILESAMFIVFPVLIYSVTIQFMLKRICLFCIGIMLVLFIQAVWGSLDEGIHMHSSILLAIFSLTAVGAFINKKVRDYFNQKLKQRQNRYELLKLKRKNYVLSNECVDFKTDDEMSIFWKKSETSTDIITSIISPSCPNCKKLAKEIFELFDKQIVSFHWKIILGETHEADKELNKIWITCYVDNPQSFFYHFRKWCYSDSNFDLHKKLSQEKQTKANEYIFHFNKKVQEYNLSGLPRLVINNRLLSSIYNGSDVLFLLIDNEINNNNYGTI